MRRAVAWVAAAVVAITAAVFVAAPASGSPRGDAWRARATAAMARFEAADSGTESVMAYAYMAEASGRVRGWTHHTTTAYLAKVYAAQHASGGWGLSYGYDAFGDGTVNPLSATYTVTLADHVGLPLLAGYEAGAVPESRIQGIVDTLMAMPRIAVPTGQCVAYSDQQADVRPSYCVHNVNSGVAHFLRRASAAGITAPGVTALIQGIVAHEAGAYRPADRWWPYMGNGPLQDVDHQGYSAQAMYHLRAVWMSDMTLRLRVMQAGPDAVERVMTTAYPGDALAPLAHLRLTSTPGGMQAWSADGKVMTSVAWCEVGDRWAGEAAQFIARPAQVPARLAQAAVYSARNAGTCS